LETEAERARGETVRYLLSGSPRAALGLGD
jgi:hypothetical protein